MSSQTPVIDPCKEAIRKTETKKGIEEEINTYTRQCNDTKYLSAEEQPNTLKDLLRYIRKYHAKDTIHGLFEKFPSPEENRVNSGRYSQAHLFEAIWKLIFLLNIDNLTPNNKRRFRKSLERDEPIEVLDYLEEKVNSGSASGICDLYFVLDPTESPIEPTSSCEPNRPAVGNAYMFTSKYYKNETGVNGVDAAEINIEAIEKYNSLYKSQHGGNSNRPTYVLVTLIKNKTAFLQKHARSDKILKQYIDPRHVYGMEDLMDGTGFPNLYRELQNWIIRRFDSVRDMDDPNKYVDTVGNVKHHLEDTLRFHQKYVVEYTDDKIKKGTDKFIWGAVARSGKTFMVGGLISKRNPDNVFILLGAISETKTQFINDVFKKYREFEDYYIIDVQSETTANSTRLKEKNIIIMSQEKLKKDNKMQINEGALNIIKTVMRKSGRTLVFFDEIHQGGGDKSQQESILSLFYSEGYTKPILIMVTATYGKPLLKYGEMFQSHSGKTELVSWSYDMMIQMKRFKIDMVCPEAENAEIQRTESYRYDDKLLNYFVPENRDKLNVMYRITKYLNSYGITDDMIASQYVSYPELVYLIPTMVENREIDGIGNVGESINGSTNAKRLFDTDSLHKLINVGPFKQYLKYIHDIVYDRMLNQTYGFNINNPHSQLWFLPTHLRASDKAENGMEDSSVFDHISKQIAELIVEVYRERFNVLVVHSVGKKRRSDTPNIFYQCISEKDVKKCIIDRERRTHQEGKSLIILTGKRLRLGISFPCVDIAIHMDPIKTYDILYQSMFRVLTERSGKTRGFFVDMVPQRAVKFIYDFSISQSKTNNPNIAFDKKQLKRTLLLFDVNGLKTKFAFNEPGVEIKSYAKIIDGLSEFMNDDKFRTNKQEIGGQINDRELVELLKTMTVSTDAKHQLMELVKRLHINVEKQKGNKANIHTNVGTQTESEDKSKGVRPKKHIEHRIEDYYPTIVKLIRNTISVYALFQPSTESSSFSIDNLFRIQGNSPKQNSGSLHLTPEDYDRIRKCEDEDILHLCYLALSEHNGNVEGLSNEQIDAVIQNGIELVKLVYEFSPENKETLNNLCDNIKEGLDDMPKKLMNEKGMFKDSSDFCPEHFIRNEKVLDTIRKYLTPKEEEKNLYGEVFTPLELVCEMLSQLPEEVWTKEDHKWLDPANGIGNFPIVVYYKLMQTLKSVPEKDRSKHIIENMLYMNELNPVNVALARKIFKWIDPKASPNIFKGDFLAQSKIGGVDKFDVIIGNPPFQKEQDGKRTGGYGGRTLWDKFIIKSLGLLSPKGYLCFITPPGWRKPESELYELMTKQNQLVYLHIFGKKDGQQLFHVSQRIDLYIIQTRTPTKNTEIVDELGNKLDIDLSKFEFLPNYEYTTISKILSTDTDNGIDILYSRSLYGTDKSNMSIKKTETYKYPVVHSITQDGLVFWYTNDKSKGHFGIPKVLLNFNENQYPVNDYEGKYGMSQITFGIPITSKKQGDDIVKAINSPKFKEIIKATKWGAFQTDWRMFKYFKPDFYKSFLDYTPETPPKHSPKTPKTRKQKGGNKRRTRKT